MIDPYLELYIAVPPSGNLIQQTLASAREKALHALKNPKSTMINGSLAALVKTVNAVGWTAGVLYNVVTYFSTDTSVEHTVLELQNLLSTLPEDDLKWTTACRTHAKGVYQGVRDKKQIDLPRAIQDVYQSNDPAAIHQMVSTIKDYDRLVKQHMTQEDILIAQRDEHIEKLIKFKTALLNPDNIDSTNIRLYEDNIKRYQKDLKQIENDLITCRNNIRTEGARMSTFTAYLEHVRVEEPEEPYLDADDNLGDVPELMSADDLHLLQRPPPATLLNSSDPKEMENDLPTNHQSGAVNGNTLGSKNDSLANNSAPQFSMSPAIFHDKFPNLDKYYGSITPGLQTLLTNLVKYKQKLDKVPTDDDLQQRRMFFAISRAFTRGINTPVFKNQPLGGKETEKAIRGDWNALRRIKSMKVSYVDADKKSQDIEDFVNQNLLP